MQEFSTGRYAGFIETNDALINGLRGIARRLSFFASNGLADMAKKLALPASPSSILPRLRERKQSNRFANFLLPDLLGRVNKTLFLSPTTFLVSRHEVAIKYFGRTSEFLMMTSERMVIPSGRYTLGQLLCSLYKRGDRWVDELDDSHLMCMVNGREARLFDTIQPGAEICISSRKSIFEA
jgi:molybdopterin converting factor small subunit